MFKKRKLFIICMFIILLTIHTNVYAIGDSYNGSNDNGSYNFTANDAQTNNSTNNNSTKKTKPSPPVPSPWWNGINWDKENHSTIWWDDNIAIIYTKQVTSNRTKVSDKDNGWQWKIEYKQMQDGNTKTIVDTKGEKSYNFTAPADGYYYISSFPIIQRTTTTYYYERTLTQKYLYRDDLDIMKFLTKSGEEPTYHKVSESSQVINQTWLTKNWSVYLKAGQRFDPSPTTKIESKTEDIDTTSTLVK